MERSLVLVKPSAMERRLAGTIISRVEKLGLKLIAVKMLRMDRSLAEKHYAAHREKPFFDGLVENVTSAPIVAAVFEGEGAIGKIRKVIGATDPSRAEPGTIRADFGLDVRRNAIHGSDSMESAEKEIKLFFSEDEIFSAETRAIES